MAVLRRTEYPLGRKRYCPPGQDHISRPTSCASDRWNYARYFIAPYLGHYRRDYETGPEGSLKAIRFWEEVIRVWETVETGTGGGEIVGVVNIEHPDPGHRGFGEICVQRHPDYGHLLDEMLDYGEKNLLNPRPTLCSSASMTMTRSSRKWRSGEGT